MKSAAFDYILADSVDMAVASRRVVRFVINRSIDSRLAVAAPRAAIRARRMVKTAARSGPPYGGAFQ
jgi:hypothetical protein